MNKTTLAPYTQESCTRDIAQFEVILTDMQKRMSAPVLDGTPFLVAKPLDGCMAHWLIVGTPYEDQKPCSPYVLRMQRGFDLCGALCSSEESAKAKRQKLEKQGILTVIIHRRDWEESCRESVLKAINALQTLKPTLPVS